jgi:hypothetical protein
MLLQSLLQFLKCFQNQPLQVDIIFLVQKFVLKYFQAVVVVY